MSDVTKNDIAIGVGAKLYYWDEDTSAYIEITEVDSLAWDGTSRHVAEVGGLNPSDFHVRKLQGLLNAGAITATIRYKFDQYLTLKNQEETRGNFYYLVELPDGAGLEWEGFISELPINFSDGEVMQGDVVFQIDGKMDFISSVEGYEPE
jgi:hypothetical protein